MAVDFETRNFVAGEALCVPGAAADNAYVLITGRVSVAANEGEPVIVGPGEIVGQIDLLLDQPCSVAVVALEDVAAVPLTRPQLAAAMQGSARAATSRAADVFAALASTMVATLGTLDRETAPAEDSATGVLIAAASERLGRQIDDRQVDGRRLALRELPYFVGRNPGRRERPPRDRVDLTLADNKPYNLSRRHFAIDRSPAGLVLRDLGSQLGTEVNGTRIGIGRPTNEARLRPGPNQVVAGRTDSPFRFRITVETD